MKEKEAGMLIPTVNYLRLLDMTQLSEMRAKRKATEITRGSQRTNIDLGDK